jgi:hypothetical protein
VLAEPVLVCVGTPYPRKIYDQGGNLLAIGKRQPNRQRLERPRRDVGLDIVDVRGIPQLRVVFEYSRRELIVCKTTAPDGGELGTIIVTGSKNGSFFAAGAPVGRLQQSLRGWASVGVGRNRKRHAITDSNDNEVGRITFRESLLGEVYNVIEIEQGTSETLRALILAASAFVDHWHPEVTID